MHITLMYGIPVFSSHRSTSLPTAYHHHHHPRHPRLHRKRPHVPCIPRAQQYGGRGYDRISDEVGVLLSFHISHFMFIHGAVLFCILPTLICFTLPAGVKCIVFCLCLSLSVLVWYSAVCGVQGIATVPSRAVTTSPPSPPSQS
ncbi:hypothetical protein BZA05DRAFT_187658 [Tricharina praecox]|uniref:uncharacterized protein n=1 Tax=Tricharina praecox TaxID=43433 RepID=UPI00221E8B26|nr:uncharacterized protein BZA05DRAFT_187658 [Tricharina praecox]KAI5843200.1 hypothetical protein BZA05DRAFT_187658 [Tricharina praecox]